MFPVFPGVKVYLATGVTDLRKSINGLSMLVADYLELDAFSGHLFAFCNRKRDMIKVLYWDRNGFCLWQKRLEKDRFVWPDTEEDILAIEVRELNWLVDGLSLQQPEAYGRLEYSIIS
jgi:transposase